ncbi:DDB1- and CUL4-associated factor 8 [Portunus trituberculatus]|uniref:DDB1-and CUL4-associated factor 8 n=1 Tax=Portunus trituberculatus TaxID=210409 RepID=A0A5B7DGC6_PORTR|nr:DDB1- and CUL4-associated factor 8 [Portunus trituberculatus]
MVVRYCFLVQCPTSLGSAVHEASHMAEETDNSLKDLVGGGESGSISKRRDSKGSNPKEKTNTPNGATTTTTSVTTTTTTTTTTGTTTATTTTTTTTSSTKSREHSNAGEGGTEGDDGDPQAKPTGDGSSSAGSSGGRNLRIRPRIYRPRMSESSSEDSDDEAEKGASRILRSVVTITGGGEGAGKDSSSPVNMEPAEEEVEMEPASPEGMEVTGANTPFDFTEDSPTTERRRAAPERNHGRQTMFGGLFSDTDSDSDDTGRRRSIGDHLEDESHRKEVEAAINTELMRIRQRPKPKHEWNFVEQTLKSNHYYDSLHVPKRLELIYKMEFHHGCVNALSFNSSGTLLASGSDDFYIAVWDWAREKATITFKSGHHNNVFQSKFLPLREDTHIVSCARDGQVRLAELSSGAYKSTRKLAKHKGPAHKLATMPTSPHVVLSAGEDAVVLNIDIREEQPSRVALVKNLSGSRISLYSIHAHPVNEHQFCVSGHDQYVRVYDRRCASLNFPVLKFCPRHLMAEGSSTSNGSGVAGEGGAGGSSSDDSNESDDSESHRGVQCATH